MIRQPGTGTMAGTFLLVLIVCLGPLPFGSVLVRERTILDVLACLALVAILGTRRGPRPFGRAPWPALALCALGLWGLFQALPWPMGSPLSIAPTVSRDAAWHGLAVAAAFLAASLAGEQRPARQAMGLGFLVITLFQVFYGARQWAGDGSVVWGMEVAGDSTRLRGTYINANHLAFFLSMALATFTAWLWWGVRRAAWPGPIEQRLIHPLAPALCFSLAFFGIAFSGSRAGLLAAILGILAMGVLLGIHHRRWQAGLVAGGLILAALGSVAWLGWRQGFSRLLVSSTEFEAGWGSRLEVYRLSWHLWLDSSPWTGTGLGTFRQAFPAVQPSSLGRTWVHAHNDWLELLVTTGVVGALLLVFGLSTLIRRLWTVFQKGRRSEDRAAGLAALGALATAALHSLFDFGIAIPANAFTLAILCGAACGASTDEAP